MPPVNVTADRQALERRVRAVVRNLDAFPLVFRKLMSILDQSFPSSRELAQVISSDPSLSVRILTMVNSAARGGRGRISSVTQAVSLVGITVIRSLTFCLASYETLCGSDEERERLWRHGLATALLAKGLGEEMNLDCAEEVFLAGVLHDMGHAILNKHCPAETMTIRARIRGGGNPIQLESDLLGFTHAEVGAWACEAWKMTEGLQASVRHHHDPDQAGPYRTAASLVHLGDMMSLSQLEPENRELRWARWDYLDEFSMTPDQVTRVVRSAMDQLKELEGFLSAVPRSTKAAGRGR